MNKRETIMYPPKRSPAKMTISVPPIGSIVYLEGSGYCKVVDISECDEDIQEQCRQGKVQILLRDVCGEFRGFTYRGMLTVMCRGETTPSPEEILTPKIMRMLDNPLCVVEN